MRIGKLIVTNALIASAWVGLASAQMPDGSVYVLHSRAHGGCPSLDWYIVVEERGILAGMIAWNDMKMMTRAAGTVDRPHHRFTMAATEIGGQGRTATIEGKARDDGRLVASIKGPSIACTVVAVPLNRSRLDATHR